MCGLERDTIEPYTDSLTATDPIKRAGHVTQLPPMVAEMSPIGSEIT